MVQEQQSPPAHRASDPPLPGAPLPRWHDRLVDVVAALLLSAGIILFAVGRRALVALANGTYHVPTGVTWVSRADYHAEQTRWGLALVAAGGAAALFAAWRHVRHRRLSGR
jgi:uncharacterized membrane protein YedE/YeeE